MVWYALALSIALFIITILWLIERTRYTHLSRSIVDLAYALHIVPIKPCSPGVALLCMRDTIRDYVNRLNLPGVARAVEINRAVDSLLLDLDETGADS